MSKKEKQFNIGDKFVITISEKYEPAGTESARQDSPETLYRMNGFKSLVFDAAGLRKLKIYEPPKPIDIEAIRDDAFYNGAREAWENAQLIACSEDDGGISPEELNEIFGTNWADDIFRDYSFTDAKDKIKAYIAKKKAEEEKARFENSHADKSQDGEGDSFKPGDMVKDIRTGDIAIVATPPEFGGMCVVSKSGLLHVKSDCYKLLLSLSDKLGGGVDDDLPF